MPFSFQNPGMKLDILVKIQRGGAFLKVLMDILTSLLGQYAVIYMDFRTYGLRNRGQSGFGAKLY
jgi:hypothetical protein